MHFKINHIMMKTIGRLSILLLISFYSCTKPVMTIINEGETSYDIVLSKGADSLEIKAANELQRYLQLISETKIPISSENDSPVSGHIFIGNDRTNVHPHMTEDGIIIEAQDNNLYISGNNPTYTLYAVYTFLEKYLDCRFYAPDAEIVPSSKTVSIPNDISYRYNPPITTRTVHSRLFYEDHEFANKRKTTYKAFPRYVPSAGVHTFHRFVPASTYLKSHPEYFALRNDRRLPTQLCLTNEEVLKIVIKEVDALLQEYPEADVISVSQDDNQQYCQCDSCMAINEREGSPSGSVIDFVNKVAAKFPDKMISTLAYQYTRTAPKNMKPGENVLITLCSIECDRSAPINEKCTAFADDLVAWGKLTDNIRIWDYTTQFTNFLAPFPNLHTLQPNIQLFRDNHAKWVFEQHSHHPSELFELRSYLTAKLLWDPDINQDSIINDFLTGYYEDAAPFIKMYIDTVHKEIKQDEDFFLFLYGDPSQGFNSFLRPELLNKYDSWYDQATKTTKGNPDMVKRINRARLSVDYAILEAYRTNDPNSFVMVGTDKNGNKIIAEELLDRIARFKQTCLESDITLMNEMRFSVEEYLASYQHAINKAKLENIAIGKPVKLLQKPKKYANEDPLVLTDGAFGGANFYANWLGFEGNNLEAIIDLENPSTIQSISADFLQVVNHIVFFPLEVDYYYSNDGKTFKKFGRVKNERPLTKQSKINDMQGYTINFSPVSARFIKIEANNMKMAPDWHHGAGLPSWIFIDEVIVR